MDEAGTTVVLAASPEFDVLRTNRMEGLFWGTPAVAGDALLLLERHSVLVHRVRRRLRSG